MAIVIDTHALIWYLAGDSRLSIRAKKRIDQLIERKERLIIPLIVLMELFILVEKKKITVSWDQLQNRITEFPSVVIYPIGIDILENMHSENKELELHDRMIVITARIHEAIIISRDEKIQAARSVEVLW